MSLGFLLLREKETLRDVQAIAVPTDETVRPVAERQALRRIWYVHARGNSHGHPVHLFLGFETSLE
jgi:hypothetical protein